MTKAISTYGITLKWGLSAANVAKKIDIKDYPDLGGEPELLETTTLSDPMQTFINGIQTSGAMPFTTNYTQDAFNDILADKNKSLYYELSFGLDGDGGIFSWEGQHDAYVTGSGVNEVPEIIMTITPASKPLLNVLPMINTVTLASAKVGTATSNLTITYSRPPSPTATLDYQWQIADTQFGSFANLSATGATYTPVAANENKYLRCKVNASGSARGYGYSNAVKVTADI